MGVFDSAGDDFSLVVRDSAAAAGPGGAVSSAMQEGVGLVLGPVFSTEAPAAGNAAGSVIPVISFSNDRSAAKPGLFVLGLAPQDKSLVTILDAAKLVAAELGEVA